MAIRARKSKCVPPANHAANKGLNHLIRTSPHHAHTERGSMANPHGHAKGSLPFLLAMLCGTAAIGAAICCLPPQSLAAQAGASKGNAPASKAPRSGTSAGSAGTAPAAAPARPAANDAAARNDILQSRSWQDTLQQFDDWLSNQVLYDDDEVRHIRARLNAGIGRMSATQLEVFLNDMRQKLAILSSDRALDAQDYLAEKFLVASDAYARRIRDQLPDLLSMSPTQVEQRLSMFAAKRRSRQQAQGAFEQSRERRLASNTAQVKARQEHRQRIGTRTTAATAAASTPNDFTPSRDYFPDVGNNGPSMVIGVGFY
jgi:hypothetical protein